MEWIFLRKDTLKFSASGIIVEFQNLIELLLKFKLCLSTKDFTSDIEIFCRANNPLEELKK